MCSPISNPKSKKFKAITSVLQEGEDLSSLSIHLSHVSVNCNRVSLTADWNQNSSVFNGVEQPVNLVAFGACGSVAIYDPIVAKIQTTLRSHKGRVNCVKWIPKLKEDSNSTIQELVSGSYDKNLHVWTYDWTSFQYRLTEVLVGHKDSVTSVDALTLPDGTVIVVSSSSDGTVKIWCRNTAQEWNLIQTIEFDRLLIECIALCSYKTEIGSTVFLAAGGLSKKIHIFERSADDGQFLPILKLEGHTDWIRGVSFCTEDSGDVLLASASQDKHIRLWRFSKDKSHFQGNLAATSDDGGGGGKGASLDINLDMKHGDDAEEQQFEALRSLGRFRHLINLNSVGELSVTLDALLTGHEDRVYSVAWHPTITKKGRTHQPMFLVSASMDKTMMIWRPDVQHGVWLNEVRMGEIGGQALGFYGGLIGPGGTRILVHGYHGELQSWYNPSPMDNTGWKADITVSGHFGAVMDICWDSQQNYLLSASTDQTVRAFAPWTDSLRFFGRPVNGELWHEMARPQVHGYNMTCISPLFGSTPHRYVSGAAEKVIRVFDAPQPFVDNLSSLSGVLSEELSKVKRGDKERSATAITEGTSSTTRALRAAVPELGLSNKPYRQGEVIPAYAGDMPGSQQMTSDVDEVNPQQALAEPPFEHYLAQNSQWPEIQKLYGHGYSLIAVCSNRAGSLIASSCIAKESKHAVVRLWTTDEQKTEHLIDGIDAPNGRSNGNGNSNSNSSSSSWIELDPLKSHSLSITQMEFSHSDDYLLTVSRDRSLTVFEKRNDSGDGGGGQEMKRDHPGGGYEVAFCVKKAHARIIWSCSWAPDDMMFATGSRDKKVKLWQKKSSTDWQCSSTLRFKSAVTALAFCPILVDDPRNHRYLLTIGFESGDIEIWCQNSPRNLEEEKAKETQGKQEEWARVYKVDPNICHAETVRRICWRVSGDQLQFATCSADHSIRLFSILNGGNKP